MAFSICAGSTSVFHRPSGNHRIDLGGFAKRPPQHFAHRGDQAADMQHFRFQRLAAPKASNWLASLAPRSTPAEACATRRSARASPAISRRKSCRLPEITCSRLLKSWATPAGQLSEGLHLLGLAKLLLGLAQGFLLGFFLGNVASIGENEIAFGRGMPRDPARRAIGMAKAVLEAGDIQRETATAPARLARPADIVGQTNSR